MVSLPSTELLHLLGALVAVAFSLLVLWLVERPDGSWGDRLRSRFVMGVPWGTLVTVAGVAAFYLVVQHGLAHWYQPVTVPYSAWSYFYPLGMVTAAFAHAGSGHLVGNLTAALVLFALSEYAYGHYPTARGSGSFSSWRTNPLVRAFVAVPVAAFVVGLATSLFGWGPIIGFSGVVFAAVGFAAVRYPVGAVVALVARDVVSLLYRSLQNPVVTTTASERFVRPWWAGIAVQGHTLGLFLGAALGVLVFYRRGLVDIPRIGDRWDEPPSPTRLWFATLLLGLSLGMHLLWWYRGGDSYVLYRALGLAFVVLVATAVTASIGSSDRPFPLRSLELSRRQVATIVLVLPILVMAGVAVPLNATVVEGDGVPDGTEPAEVRGYGVVYAEDVENRMVSVVDVEAFGETTAVTTSGVIVVSERRNVWTRRASKGKLASSGCERVVLGGPTWRRVVDVDRTGWSAVGGPAAYAVRMQLHDAGDEPARCRVEGSGARLAYTSGPANASPVLAGRNVSMDSGESGFVIRVTRNNSTVGTAPVPTGNETTTAGGITFERDGRAVVASVEGTRVVVFRREKYN